MFLNYSSLNGGKCWNFGFVSVAFIDSEIVDWFYNVTRRVLSLTRNLWRDRLQRIPDFAGFEISVEARQAERAVVSGVDKQEHFDFRATFFATYPACDCSGI